MPNAIDVLRANGVLRPEITIRAAADVGLDLASAATMVIGESGGGRMIWGHDPGDPLGIYVKGGPVTRENYLAYEKAMAAGRIKRQGVGDAQLTSAEYQDRGDALGGCWLPYPNQRAGFTGLARLQKSYGLQQGFRRYNGSGAQAEKYGRDKMAARTIWANRLSGVTVPSIPDAFTRSGAVAPVAPAPVPAPTEIVEDDAMFPVEVYWSPDGKSFRALANIECGAGSVFTLAWARFTSVWGAADVDTWAQDGKGKMTRLTQAASPRFDHVPSNRTLSYLCPAGTRLVTWEGTVSDPKAGTVVSPSGVAKT